MERVRRSPTVPMKASNDLTMSVRELDGEDPAVGDCHLARAHAAVI
jgi:hypothetical protein